MSLFVIEHLTKTVDYNFSFHAWKYFCFVYNTDLVKVKMSRELNVMPFYFHKTKQINVDFYYHYIALSGNSNNSNDSNKIQAWQLRIWGKLATATVAAVIIIFYLRMLASSRGERNEKNCKPSGSLIIRIYKSFKESRCLVDGLIIDNDWFF